MLSVVLSAQVWSTSQKVKVYTFGIFVIFGQSLTRHLSIRSWQLFSSAERITQAFLYPAPQQRHARAVQRPSRTTRTPHPAPRMSYHDLLRAPRLPAPHNGTVEGGKALENIIVSSRAAQSQGSNLSFPEHRNACVVLQTVQWACWPSPRQTKN